MKLNKMVIIMVAVVAIGVFALPTTLSVGSQQHKFRQAGSSANGQTDLVDFCGQCHGTAGDTLYNSGNTGEIQQSDKDLYFTGITGSSGRIHSSLFAVGKKGCAECHEITGGYANPGGQIAKTEHAAKIPSCLKCHGPGADVGLDVTVELSKPSEAHKDVYTTVSSTGKDDLMCVGCHTYVTKSGAVSYTFSAGTTVNGLTIGN